MTFGQSVVVLVMGLIAVLSGTACWYFGARYRPRSVGVLALVGLTGFIFLVDVLWGAVYYVAVVAQRVMTFEGVVSGLFVPVLGVGVVGLLATGLVFLLIVRREVSGEG